MATTCTRCARDIPDNKWFCNFCGKERPKCPDCGADMNETQCISCGLPRKGPCTKCGKLITASTEECQHCGHSISSSGKSLTFWSAGIIIGLSLIVGIILSIIIPGPTIVDLIIVRVFLVGGIMTGGIISFLGVGASMMFSENHIISLEKGEKQNQSPEWAEEQRQREHEREMKEKELQSEQSRSEVEAPSECPYCGTSWSGFVNTNYNRLGDKTFECAECGRTKDFG